MQVQFTVRARDGDLGDVNVAAPPDTPFDLVVERLAALGFAVRGAPLWLDDRPVDDATTVRCVRNGAVLGIGVHADPPSRPALSLDVVGGPAAGLHRALATGRLTIGRSPGCDVSLYGDADVSRVHAVLDVTPSGVSLADAGSTNGTRVEGQTVATATAIQSGAQLRLGDSFLTVRAAEHTPAVLRELDGKRLVNRSPRPAAPPAAEVVLPSRPVRPAPQRIQLLAALLPAIAGVGFAWVLHAPQFLFFALLSPVMLLATALGDRLHWRRSRRRAAIAFRAEMDVAARAVADGLQRETQRRRNQYPDPACITVIATLPSSRLWERRRSDPDRLEVRLGLADLPSELTVRENGASRPAGRCVAVPLTTPLRDGALGIWGPSGAVGGLARWLLVQLCVQHPPSDVQFVILASAEASWRWARWLPHVRGCAAGSAAWADTVADLAALTDARRRDKKLQTTPWTQSWIVVLVDGLDTHSDVPGLAQLLATSTDVGVTAVCLAERAEALPPGCCSVAGVVGDTGTRMQLSTADGGRHAAVLDQVGETWAEDVARHLAAFTDGDGDTAALPTECRLTDLFGDCAAGPQGIVERWARSDGGAATVVGVDADGAACLDLVRDGPHALVAGTTGAGKSELLQTLITGLALNHPPGELNFLLIDYKGGAAFAECARLPHTAGLVTDLNAQLTRRALRSLDAEILRRERLFAAAGSSDLAGYASRCPSQPLARMVIVVDEFATLAEELPDFVRGLVGIAQRGRSLGFHLVLATQRPSGVVSADIRANTELRIALRVADPAESSDVIDGPDAARIPKSTPGRAYLRTAAAPHAFQTARVSCPARESDSAVVVERLGGWRTGLSSESPSEPTDLAMLVEHICGASSAAGFAGARTPWQPPLPRTLSLDHFDAGPPACVPIGLSDRPSEQEQHPYAVELDAPAAMLIVGGPRSGRSTAVATLVLQAARRIPPGGLHVHVVDPSGALSALQGLPHCGTYAGPEATAQAATLIERLRRLVEQRRRRSGDRTAPRVLLAVDGWEPFASASDERDAGRTTEGLVALARDGAAVGLLVVLTGDRSTLSPRISAAFPERLVLRMSDRADYGMAGIAAHDVPAEVPAGRALRASDALEVQLGFVGTAPDHAEQRRIVAELAARDPGGGSLALRIRPLPPDVRLDRRGVPRARWLLGVGGDLAEAITVDYRVGIRMVVAGPPRSGRTTLLRSLLAQVVDADVVVAAPARSLLRRDAESGGVPVLSPAHSLPNGFADGSRPAVALVDDVSHLDEGPLASQLHDLVRSATPGLTVIAAGRSDELATTYRGLGAELRRNRCGLLLQPGPADGDILGLRLARQREYQPPGRGILVGEPAWGPAFVDAEPIPIQVARL